MMDAQAMSRVPIKMLDGDVTWKTLDLYAHPALFISTVKKR